MRRFSFSSGAPIESLRGRARADEHAFRSEPKPPRRGGPVALGEVVLAYGERGIVTAIDYSVSTGERIITVQHSPRIRVRIPERDIEVFA